MAKTVFQLKVEASTGEEGGGLCLERTGSVLGHARVAEGPLAVAPCNAAAPLQLWHLGNRGDDGWYCCFCCVLFYSPSLLSLSPSHPLIPTPTRPHPPPGECCAGLRGYDSDQCVRDRGGSYKPDTGVCAIDGSDTAQRAALQGNGKIELRGKRCLGVASSKLAAGPCAEIETRWEKVNEKTSLERSIYDKEVAGRGG